MGVILKFVYIEARHSSAAVGVVPSDDGVPIVLVECLATNDPTVLPSAVPDVPLALIEDVFCPVSNIAEPTERPCLGVL